MTVELPSETIRHSRRFISRAMNAPLLTAEEEQKLARRWREHDDEAALHRLVFAYVRLVVSVATRFKNYGLPVAELVQEGSVGLMQAAARFEPERGIRFSTYATWWIRSSMQEYILRNWSIVRSGTSAAQKSLFFNLRWMRAQIERSGDSLMSVEVQRQLAERLKVKERDVEQMAVRLQGQDQSLNVPVSAEGNEEWGAFLVDDTPSPEDVTIKLLDNDKRVSWLTASLNELSDREKMIITERRLNEDRVTLEELGGRLGITKERVRQIEHKAIEKLSAAVVKRAEAAGVAAV